MQLGARTAANNMRKCEYCGGQNEDANARCIACGTEFLVPTAHLRDFEPRRLDIKKHLFLLRGVYPVGFVRVIPVFGTISISAPFVGAMVALIITSAVHFGGDMGGLARLYYFIGIVFLALLIGGISGLIGLARGEKHRIMSFAGIVMDFAPIVALLLRACLRPTA